MQPLATAVCMTATGQLKKCWWCSSVALSVPLSDPWLEYDYCPSVVSSYSLLLSVLSPREMPTGEREASWDLAAQFQICLMKNFSTSRSRHRGQENGNVTPESQGRYIQGFPKCNREFQSKGGETVEIGSEKLVQ